MQQSGMSPLEEPITLQQAKKLIQCMAHEQSFLLLSPPGVGKSEMVYQAAREANLPCRSLLGTQISSSETVVKRSEKSPSSLSTPDTGWCRPANFAAASPERQRREP